MVWLVASGEGFIVPPLPLGEGWGEGCFLLAKFPPHPNPLPEGEGTLFYQPPGGNLFCILYLLGSNPVCIASCACSANLTLFFDTKALLPDVLSCWRAMRSCSFTSTLASICSREVRDIPGILSVSFVADLATIMAPPITADFSSDMSLLWNHPAKDSRIPGL